MLQPHLLLTVKLEYSTKSCGHSSQPSPLYIVFCRRIWRICIIYAAFYSLLIDLFAHTYPTAPSLCAPLTMRWSWPMRWLLRASSEIRRFGQRSCGSSLLSPSLNMRGSPKTLGWRTSRVTLLFVFPLDRDLLYKAIVSHPMRAAAEQQLTSYPRAPVSTLWTHLDLIFWH